MASCCAPRDVNKKGAAKKPRGRRLVLGGEAGACDCASGDQCECETCTCLGCPCKPERVLTAALKRTGSPAQLNDLVRRHWGRLNAVHVSAALNSLAAFVSAEENRRHLVEAAGGGSKMTNNATTTTTTTTKKTDAEEDHDDDDDDDDEGKKRSLTSTTTAAAATAAVRTASTHHSSSAPSSSSPHSSSTSPSPSPFSSSLSSSPVVVVVPLLLDALGRHVSEMAPRALSASVWTLAILRPSSAELAPLAPLVAAAVKAHLERGSFEGRDVAIVMWSYATLGPSTLSHLPLGAHLPRAFETYLLRDANATPPQAPAASAAMSPRDLSMLLWSAAALQLRGVVQSAAFIREATWTVTSGAMKMEPRHLAQCLWGFATLATNGVLQGGGRLDGGGGGSDVAAAVVGLGEGDGAGEEDEGMTVVAAPPRDVECERAQAGFLNTCAALVALPRFTGIVPRFTGIVGDETCTGVGTRERHGGRGANPQDLSNVLHSFAACRWHPGNDAMRAVAAAVTCAAEAFTAEEAADALWAIATLHPPCEGLNLNLDLDLDLDDVVDDEDGDRAAGGSGAGAAGAGASAGAGSESGYETSPDRDRSTGCSLCSCSSDARGVVNRDGPDAAAAADDDDDDANDDDDDLGATVSDAVAALSHRVAALCAAASPSSSSSSYSPCCFTFDAQATSKALWASAVLGRCTRPEAAPLWRAARAKIQVCLMDEEGGSAGSVGFSEAGLVQLFYASWCFLEEQGGGGVYDDDADDEDGVMEAKAAIEMETGFADESMLETVRRIHEYTAEVVSHRRERTSANTSKLQLAVAAAAELRGRDGGGGLGLQEVEVEAEVVIGRSVSVATTVDLLLTTASSVSFIVEVDGPTHFTRGGGGPVGQRGGRLSDRRREVGGTALRNRLMRWGLKCARGRGRNSRVEGFVALPYHALDEASRLGGGEGIAEVLRDALVRAGARVRV